MSFVLRMAARELRASWRRLLFFFVCVAIGVGAIVALRSIVQSVRAGLTREARALLAADVVIQTNRGWDAAVRQRLDSSLADPRVRAHRNRWRRRRWCGRIRRRKWRGWWSCARCRTAFRSTAPSSSRTAQPFSHDLLKDRGVLVRPDLLAQFDERVGDRIVIGGQPFTIRGVISKEPGRRAGAFSLGSRVIVDYDDLKKTGLLSFGSRANEQILLKVRDGSGSEALARDLRRGLPRPLRHRPLLSGQPRIRSARSSSAPRTT